MINRNNYEEYLVLYIDGELSSAERKSVESFLELNPDLKEELQLLQQTILQPEDIRFTNKTVLYKQEAGINTTNYQEYFLLYVDAELNDAQKEEVETFVLQNPGLQDEFTLLKQTILTPEPLIFANKELLYRKEEKRRTVVISMRWASLAAAVMIGIVAMLWIVNNENHPADSRQVATKTPQENKIAPGATRKPQQQNNIASVNENISPLVAGKPGNTQPAENSGTAQQRTPQVQVAVVQKQEVPQQSVTESPVIAATTKTDNSSQYSGAASYGGTTEEPVTRTSAPDENTSYVQPAVYREELNTEEEGSNKNVLVGALQINPDKVRGLFRKAGRFLSNKVKNRDDDGDKVQIANIEVNKLK
jgi:hypothetical protein